MFALLVTIALALTLGGTHAQISPPQPAVLSKAIETLNSSSLVRYLSNYAIGAIDQGVSDNYTRSILTTYPQLNDLYTNGTLDADELHVLGFALNHSNVAPSTSAPVARAFADAMALIVKDTNETVNGTMISPLLPAAALNGLDWESFAHIVMAVETVERSKSVLGFTNLSNNLPANLTELLDDIIRTLQIAVLRQGLVLAEEYSVEDVLTLIRNIAGSMTMTSTTSGPSVALLQSLNVNQAQALVNALAAYGLSAYLSALSAGGLIDALNTRDVLVAMSKIP